MRTIHRASTVIQGASNLLDVVRGNDWNVWHDALDLARDFGNSWPAFALGDLPEFVPIHEDEIGEQFGNDDVTRLLAGRGLTPCHPSDAFRLAACYGLSALQERWSRGVGEAKILPRQIVPWHEPLPNRFGVLRRLCLYAGSAGDGVFHVDAGPELRWRYASPTFQTRAVFLARPAAA